MKRLILAVLLLLLAAGGTNAQQSVALFYVATSVDASGTESGFSNEVSATVTPAHKIVDLSWIASTSTVAGYNVYRSKVAGGPYLKINATLISGLTFTDTFSFPSPPVMNPPVVP